MIRRIVIPAQAGIYQFVSDLPDARVGEHDM
jgi:hypothetical protein